MCEWGHMSVHSVCEEERGSRRENRRPPPPFFLKETGRSDAHYIKKEDALNMSAEVIV